MEYMKLAGVWVFVEHRRGNLLKIAREVLSEGRRLADQQKGEVVAVLLGYHLDELIKDVGKHGADKILLVEDPVLEEYCTLPYCNVLSHLVQEHKPAAVLFGATSTVNDLAPRLAARMKAGLVTNCNLVETAEDGVLEVTKPAYGGTISITLRFPPNRLQLVTLPPGGEIITRSVLSQVIHIKLEEIGSPIVESIGFSKLDPEAVDLSEADLVVAGGRGLGEEGFHKLREFAKIIGASIGGTRIAVDNGWIPFPKQIGQTGKTVSSRFFMTLGTSGAIQYTMGFKDSGFIIAVDKNPRAPIFDAADIGVVADVHQVLPALIELLDKEYTLS